MKLPKNILILLGSYLGAVALVVCIAQLAVTQTQNALPVGGTDTSGGDVLVDVPHDDTDDVPTVSIPDADATGGNGDTEESGAESEPTQESATVYFLRTVTEDGAPTHEIGIYDESGALLDVLDTPVYALPAEDRAQLGNGIEVRGEEALRRLLEDLGE